MCVWFKGGPVELEGGIWRGGERTNEIHGLRYLRRGCRAGGPGVGKHVQDIIFWFAGVHIFRSSECLVLLPVRLPLGLQLREGVRGYPLYLLRGRGFQFQFLFTRNRYLGVCRDLARYG